MDNAIQKLVEQAPWAAAMLGLTWMLLKAAEKERAERISNAKEKADNDRAHNLEVNRLWAENIRALFDKQEVSSERIVAAIQTMHRELTEQYESMGITKDLYDAAKKILTAERRER